MREKGISETEMTLGKALKILDGQYGWSRIKEHFEDILQTI